MLLGGRAAEEVFIGEISTGAGNDLERATDIIKSMASIYGMSDVAGLMVISRQNNSFLGGSSSSDCSDKMAEDLDTYIKNILDERYKEVVKKLEEYKECIENIVVSLNKHETIDGDQLREIIHAYEEEKGIKSLKNTKTDTKTEDSSDEK